MVNAIPDNSPLSLLPLFFPNDRTRLLILGWHLSLVISPRWKWKEIEVYVEEKHRKIVLQQLSEITSGCRTSIRLSDCIQKYSPTAILVCGFGPFAWKKPFPPEIAGRGDIPFTGIARGQVEKYWTALNPRESYVMEAIPLIGMNPSLWAPVSKFKIPWSIISPRGRVERPWLQLNALLRMCRFPNNGWKLIVSNKAHLLSQFISKASPNYPESGCYWYHTKNNTLLVFLSGAKPSLILKIPLSLKAQLSLGLHYNNVTRLKNRLGKKEMGELLPDIQLISLENFTGVVERIMPGISAFRFLSSPRRLRPVIYSAAEVLGEWQKKELVRVMINSDVFEKFWERPLFPLYGRLKEIGRENIYLECLDILKRKMVGELIPLVPVHGDFWLNNLLWDQKRRCITGILDWDESRPEGLPLLDIFHLLSFRTHYFYEYFSRCFLIQTLKRNFPGKFGEISRIYCSKLNIPFSQVAFLFCRYWLGEAANSKKIDGFITQSEPQRALDLLHQYLLSARG